MYSLLYAVCKVLDHGTTKLRHLLFSSGMVVKKIAIIVRYDVYGGARVRYTCWIADSTLLLLLLFMSPRSCILTKVVQLAVELVAPRNFFILTEMCHQQRHPVLYLKIREGRQRRHLLLQVL